MNPFKRRSLVKRKCGNMVSFPSLAGGLPFLCHSRLKKLLLTSLLLFFPILAFGATTNQTFTSTGSWVCPIGVTAVQVELRAPGGGSGGITTDTFAIGGAAGGQYVRTNAFAVTPGNTYTVTIGNVGAAGSATGPTDGTAGGDTWFSSNDANGVVAKGGLPSLANSRTGGVGSTTGAVGDVKYAGGSGATSTTTNGGGGGEGGCSDKAGGDGAVRTGGSGGDGGDGGLGATNGVGGAPSNYGGGGAGSASTSTNNRAGRAGAAGNAVLTWTNPPISALTDNFNNNSIGAEWYVTNATYVVETNQQLEVTVNSGSNDNCIVSSNGVGGDGLYDLSNSGVSVKIVDAAGSGDVESRPILLWTPDYAHHLKFAINSSVLYAICDDDWAVSVAYNATNHRYLRISQSGSNVLWDYSSDGKNWTNLRTLANPFTLTSMLLQIGIVGDGTNTVTAKFDNVNIIPTAALTGTATASITEADIVSGGKTIILTLTNDTWIAAGAASFDLQRQNIINGIDSAQSEATGWDLVPKALQGVAGVVRTSDTVVTITLDAFATYNITATETITATIPATALTGAVAIVATPTFDITTSAGGTPMASYYYQHLMQGEGY